MTLTPTMTAHLDLMRRQAQAAREWPSVYGEEVTRNANTARALCRRGLVRRVMIGGGCLEAYVLTDAGERVARALAART